MESSVRYTRNTAMDQSHKRRDTIHLLRTEHCWLPSECWISILPKPNFPLTFSAVKKRYLPHVILHPLSLTHTSLFLSHSKSRRMPSRRNLTSNPQCPSKSGEISSNVIMVKIVLRPRTLMRLNLELFYSNEETHMLDCMQSWVKRMTANDLLTTITPFSADIPLWTSRQR